MKVLQDIAYILDRHQVRYIDVLTNPRAQKSTAKEKEESRYYAFYAGLRDEQWETDEDAAASFGMQANDARFKKLKSETLKRLVNSVLFVGMDIPDKTTFEHHLQEVTRILAVLQSLARYGAKTAFFHIAETALRKAEEIENLAACVEILKIMKSIAANNIRFRKYFLLCRDKLHYYWPAYQAEMEIRGVYEDFIYPYATTKMLNAKMADEAKFAYKKIAHYQKTYKEYSLNFYAFHLEYYSKYLRGDWRGSLQPLQKMLILLESKKFKPETALAGFLNMEAFSLIMLRKYSEAKVKLEKACETAVEGQPIWFKTHELLAANAFHSKDYRSALEQIKIAFNHKRFYNIGEMDQDSWRMYGGYLLFIGVINKICCLSAEEFSYLRKFKINKLLNDTGLYSLDKRGGNIPRTVLNVLFLLLDLKQEKNDCKIVEKEERLCNAIEALRKYKDRNLDGAETYQRTDCFIKLLGLLAKYYNDPALLQEKGRNILEEMTKCSNTMANTSFEVEVIDYEYQWDWIINIIEDKVQYYEAA